MFSLKHLRLREQRRQSLQKFAQKAPQPPALNPRQLPALRAEVTGRSVGSDASPLSCFSSAQAPYRSFPPKAAKTHSFRCVSSSHRTRFAGLRRGSPCPRAGQRRRVRERAAAQPTPELTGAAAARPGAPDWPGPAWPGRTGSGCCSWCRPSSRRPRRCRGWWTRRPGCSPA